MSKPIAEGVAGSASAEESVSRGLNSPEVSALQARYGFNEIPEKRPNRLVQFLRYFWGPIPWMIEIAAALSLAVQNWDDFAIILVLLLANGLVGFWEEGQAGNAVAALRARLAVQARVLREGQWVVIPARELVPGDRIRLRPGDLAPADLVLSGPGELQVDQSALTGESLPVSKTTGATVYSSSLVTRGEAEGRVTGTGTQTFFGRTAELVESTHPVSHFQRAILQIGNFLIVIAVVLASIITVVSIFRGAAPITTLQFALILTIAAIPAAMPTVLSVTMAIGARKMAEQQAVVTRLSAMEELAGMDVLCSDKTGTLTQNRITMGDPFPSTGVTPDMVVLAAALASRVENRDPIDLAVLARNPAGTLTPFSVTDYHPFDPTTKRTEAAVRDARGTAFSVSKGAVQVIFGLSNLAGPERARADRAVEEFAARGYRTLGVARTDASGRWTFLGILPLYDPLRSDAREVVAEIRSMGVGVKILTGDQLAIGQETARQLGLGTRFIPAEELHQGKGAPPADVSAVDQADGFAQVFPEDKFAIVDQLQREDHIVGMTGDGVNDAPALKKADVGVAVSGATDVARGAASVVLLSPGLKVLVNGITESRRIFARMTSYAIYRVGETLRLLLFISLSILVFDLFPVTALMIILIAVLNDGTILTIAYDRASVSATPTRWDMRTVLVIAAVMGVVGVSFSFLLFVLALRVWVLPFATVQTMMYLKLSVSGHLAIFATRTKGPFWRSRPASVLIAAVLGAQAVATLVAVSGLLFSPLPLFWVGVVWGFSVLAFIAFDLAKQATYRLLAWTAKGKGTRRRPGSARLVPAPTHFYHERFGAPSMSPSGFAKAPPTTAGSSTAAPSRRGESGESPSLSNRGVEA